MSDTDLEFEITFTEERAEWTEKVRILSVRMKNIREIPEIQVELYSGRQTALEYAYKLGQILSKLNAKYRNERKLKMEYYTTSSNVKYGANEKTALIEGDLSDIGRKIDTIDNQMKFMNETIKTIDHFIYGIKARISLETFMRGGE
jgi:hypothetical protein